MEFIRMEDYAKKLQSQLDTLMPSKNQDDLQRRSSDYDSGLMIYTIRHPEEKHFRQNM